MTTENVPDPSNPIDPHRQATLILEAFSTWLRERPGRRIMLALDEEGYRVALDDPPRALHGPTLLDSGAQAAQVVRLESDETASGAG